MIHVYTGSCHCGNAKLAFRTSIAAPDFHPRACDCSFCTKHGAAYISDPRGSLTIESKEELVEYRQGSGSARMLLCGRCGVMLGALYDDGARTYGTVNSGCIDAAAFGERQSVSPQQLSPGEKSDRWKRLWIAEVEWKRGGV
jgi:hypothetical protein